MTILRERTTLSVSPRTPLRAVEIGFAVLGLVAALLIVLDPPGIVRAVVVLVPLVLLPGWTLVRRFPAIEPAARLLFTFIGSVLFLTVVSTAMVLLHAFHPRPVMAVILVLSAVAVGVRPVAPAAGRDRPRAGEALPRETVAHETRVLETPAHETRATRRSADRGRRPVVPWVALAVAAALWIVGLLLTNSDSLGTAGLLTAFPIYWYLSVAVVFVTILFGLFASRRTSGLLGASLGLLITILYMSANLVESAPRLPWVYKHIAVVSYIEAHGSVNPNIDIYNRWPGFFSFSASLGTAIGYRNPVSYAAWAELAFALIDAVLVLAIARTLSRHRRWAWTAVLVFTIGNWVGQNYFSPQAFAFMLYLTACLLALATLGAEPRRLLVWFEGRLGRFARTRGRALNAEVLGIATSGRTKALAIGAIVVLQIVITISHQLTPYVAVLALLPLLVFGYLRPLWLAVVLVAVPVAYLVPNIGYVQQHFGLFSSFDPVANATTASVSSVGITPAAALQSHGVDLLTGLIVVLALAGFVRRIGQGHVRTTLVVAWLAFAPVFTFFGQSYGGEGKFRVLLFGLPFWAMGVGWLFWSGRVARPATRNVLLAVTTTVLLALFVSTYYQPEASVKVAGGDVKAAEWLDQHFRPGDLGISVYDDFPFQLGADYPNFSGYNQTASLSDIKGAATFKVDASTLLPYLKDNLPEGHTWFVFSGAQEHAAVVAGYFTQSQLDAMEKVVASISTVRYDRDGSTIYEVTKN